MKILTTLLTLFLAFSCVENVPSYDSLTEAQKAELLNRANVRCATDNATAIADYKSNSNNYLANYLRGDAWKIDATSGTNTTTTNLYVWKRTATATYFLYKYQEVGEDKYNFIKMTTTINNQMIDDLKTKKCNKFATNQSVGGPTSTSVSMSYSKLRPDPLHQTDNTYSARAIEPIFFFNYNKKIVTRTYATASSETPTATATVEYKIKDMTFRETELLDFYSTYPGATTTYCVAVPQPGTPVTFLIPFTFRCEASPASNVNKSGDPVYDFIPSAEL